MGFASRSDLLARSNARRLAQLAVPADMDMVPDEALRVAIAGGELDGFTPREQEALVLALDAIDHALADADALLLSYSIPEAVRSTLLGRLASTVALYYLQGAERMTDDVRRAYEGVLDTLKAHARGDINLVPAAPDDPMPSDDLAIIESQPRRFGRRSDMDEVGL
ncbi:putative Gp36-like prophage protein (Mu-like prophage FluMu) (plasmid) [Ralstonia solanacearum CMR15]|nr:putative Gp36-like prophage protein (Mu-like prophage FluMu) [Ralstonia solanacearum CMR15]